MGKQLSRLLFPLVVLLASFPHAWAEQQQPFHVSEAPIIVAPKSQFEAAVSGRWAIWRDEGDQNRISGKDLSTGADFTFSTVDHLQHGVDINGDTVVTVEASGDSGEGVFGYRIPSFERFVIAPPTTGTSRRWPRIDGTKVVWAQGVEGNSNIHVFDLSTGKTIALSNKPSLRQEWPDVSGDIVVWRDSRFAPTVLAGQYIVQAYDIYGYDLSQSREFRITTRSEAVGPPSISGNVVVWPSERGGTAVLLAYDLVKKQEFMIAELPGGWFEISADIDGSIVVWSGKGEFEEDIFGYDLAQDRMFLVSRAIGKQRKPRISGKTIIWDDTRNAGVGKYEHDSDIYSATLESELSERPSVSGAPESVDAKIEILWPHGGLPVERANKANIGAWLFWTDTLELAPCQWAPKALLWRAINSEPAKVVAVGQKQGDRYIVDGKSVPSWEFNDVDVSGARNSQNKLYFFVTIDGMASRANIWSHGADARTYFPVQDVPVGVAPTNGAVDAKIEIVWPHDGAPVELAQKVNVSAMIFSPGTSLSVPLDWNPKVYLYRSLNTGVSERVSLGKKRIVQSPNLSYPVWDFDDVDVSAANDPSNKYYFTLDVEGVTTFTNVWSHGTDARTYAPEMDTPTASCTGG